MHIEANWPTEYTANLLRMDILARLKSCCRLTVSGPNDWNGDSPVQKAAAFGQVSLGNVKAKGKLCGCNSPLRPPGPHGFIGIVSLTPSSEREGQCGSEKHFLFLPAC